MPKVIFAALVLAVGLAVSSTVVPLAAVSATPGPLTTPLPEITHVISRPLCTALRKRIAPAIGMMLQNDQSIAKGPPLFHDYNVAFGNGEEGRRNIALLRMENLVSPIANNIIAIKKQLSDPELFPDRPTTSDAQQAIVLRNQLLKALATQEAALDIVNGFVQTQQMADLQHADEALLKQLSSPGDLGPGKDSTSQPTPDPFTHDPNYAGLAPNPYYIDPTTLPGLTLGYNKITRLNDALEWTRTETGKRETTVAQSVTQVVRLCGGAQAPSATPTP